MNIITIIAIIICTAIAVKLVYEGLKYLVCVILACCIFVFAIPFIPCMPNTTPGQLIKKLVNGISSVMFE